MGHAKSKVRNPMISNPGVGPISTVQGSKLVPYKYKGDLSSGVLGASHCGLEVGPTKAASAKRSLMIYVYVYMANFP